MSGSLRLIVVIAACSAACARAPREDPAETQAGSAAAQRQGPQAGASSADCRDLPSADQLKDWLRRAPKDGGEAGGLFSGMAEWASVVDRQGHVCVTAVATDAPPAAWPGSQSIAMAKAYTANAFSTDTMPLSTARLYTLTQPGHSLWGLAAANPFNPDCLSDPDHSDRHRGEICGGVITFGGGVPLYRAKTRVGGLGVSGDTACADHEIAKRIRHLAALDPEKGPDADDITYSSVDGASAFTHPLCANTWRNGRKIGDEANAAGY